MLLSVWEADMIADEIGRRREFHDGFQRSKRGNLWCRHGDLTLSIFENPQGSGFYWWCIADTDGPHYGSIAFETEDEAMESLYEVVNKLEGEAA
jgi:hypothetical protein